MKGKTAVASRTQRFSKERVQAAKTFSRPMAIRLQGEDDIELDKKLAVVIRNFGSASNFFSAALWYYTEGYMTAEQMHNLQGAWVRHWGSKEDVPFSPFDRSWADFEHKEFFPAPSDAPSAKDIDSEFSGSEKAPNKLGTSSVEFMLQRMRQSEKDG